MASTLTIKGGKELNAKLQALPEKIREAAGRRSARRAMAIVREAARANLAALHVDDPSTRANISQNVYIQQSRRQSARIGGVVMRVGILGGAERPVELDENAEAQPGGDTRHWRYVEFGTEKVATRPFLRPALENNAQAVLTTLTDELNKELDKIAKGS